MRRDLDDLEHDAGVDRAAARGEACGDRVFRSREHPCPAPQMCDWCDGVCRTCGCRLGPEPETLVILDMANLRRGGLQLTRDEVPLWTWQVLGRLEADEQAMRAALSGALGGLR